MALGLIGKKVGMTQIYTDDRTLVPVTVIQAGPCTVVQAKTSATDGYAAVQLGFGQKKPQRATKAYQGHCVKAEKGVFEVLREFRVEEEGEDLNLGQQISVDGLFKAGDRVDVTGTSKGRGFAGVLKRHSFAGFPASHGTHEYFRHGGSIGNRSYPGRVFKGKRMAGHFGNERVTTQNLEVVAVRPEENLILLRGAVPGARGGVILVHPTAKAKKHE
jgi:large subunit ribosomal protein L3